MTARRLFSSALVATAVFFYSCGDNTTNPGEIKAVDSPALDSTTPAHVQDPSTAFPQPPVTGSQVDSSRSQDSAKKKGDTTNKH